MFSVRIREVMRKRKLLTARPETTVAAAARRMARRGVGAVLVVEDGRLAGIFTERDAVYRVIAEGLDPGTTTLAQVMTASPETASPDDTFGHALLVMQERGFRHMPVVVEGAPVGIVSARNALDPDLEEFTFESERRRHLGKSRPA
jgi:CBS domain-containing protein